MRGIIVVLVCVMIAPLAFAQTKTGEVKRPAAQASTTTETATSNAAGTIRNYQPGKAIVINSTQGPVSFIPGGSMQIVNSAGNAVTSALTPGANVRVYYTGTGANRVAERVVVEQ